MPMYPRAHTWREDRLHVSGGVLLTGIYRQRSNTRNALAIWRAPFRLSDCVEPDFLERLNNRSVRPLSRLRRCSGGVHVQVPEQRALRQRSQKLSGREVASDLAGALADRRIAAA